MTTDQLVTMSLWLKGLPYDFKFAGFFGLEGGYSVELVTKDGKFSGSGISEKSFVAAYTAAESDLRRNEREYYADKALDFGDREQELFLQGARRL